MIIYFKIYELKWFCTQSNGIHWSGMTMHMATNHKTCTVKCFTIGTPTKSDLNFLTHIPPKCLGNHCTSCTSHISRLHCSCSRFTGRTCPVSANVWYVCHWATESQKSSTQPDMIFFNFFLLFLLLPYPLQEICVTLPG